jgi:hypothetical protein
MPIQAEQRSDGWYITGLTQGGAEAFAGQRLFRPGNGPWFVGFDDRFADPLVVRAYYDPQQDPRDWNAVGVVQYVGLVQFVEVAFLGQPVAPQALGGAFADRGAYAGTQPPYSFVDFMGPAQATMLEPSRFSPLDPFFAFNGALVDGSLRNVPGDFAVHPLPNGSLRLWTVTASNQSLAASMVTEVSASLISPSNVAKELTAENLYCTIPCTAQDLAQHEAYEIALNYLTQPGQELNGIDFTQVGARVVGPYVLFSLPDPEDMAPILCVSSAVSGSQGQVYVHLLDYDDLDTMEEDADADALNRIWDFLEAYGLQDTAAMDDDDEDDMDDYDEEDEVESPAGRGRGGLQRSPFDVAPGEPCLELRYRTVAFGRRSRPTRAGTITPLSAVSWAAVYEWDEDTRTLQLTSIREPETTSSFDQDTLDRYYYALWADGLKDQTVDTSYFVKAAMRRYDFGAGLKPAYIDSEGAAV